MKTFYRSILSLFFTFFCCANLQAQVADFSSDVISGCDPLVVSFTDKSTGTGASTIYAWDFGDGKTSSLKNPSTTYITTGTFTAKLTVKNGTSGTPSSKTITIIVYPSPTIGYTAVPVSGCPCTNVIFTNTSVPNSPGAYTTIWSFGDGSIATTTNTNYTYCPVGKYTVAIKVTNSAGCSRTRADTSKIEVFEPPVCNFTADKTTICKIPDNITFSPTVGKGKAPYTYFWDFGDLSATSSATSPTHSYTAGGKYTVRLIITDANGCKDTAEKVDYIDASPMNSSFKMPKSICVGTSMVLFESSSTPTPIATKWTWSDGVVKTGLNPQRDFNKGGTFTFTMIDSFGLGCIDTAIGSYLVNPKPRPNFSYWPIYPCPAPVTINFTNKSNDATSYKWIFGDGTTSTATSPSHTYTWDSVFTVYLIAKTDSGCLDTFRVRDTTKAFPGGYPNPFYDSSNSPIIVRVYDARMSINTPADTNCIPKTYSFEVSLRTNTHLPSAEDTSATPFCGAIKGYKIPYWLCNNLPSPDPYPDEFKDIWSWPMPPEPPFEIGYPYPIRSGYFDYGDGSTGTSFTHTYTTEGKFMVKITVFTDSCSFTDSIEVEAGTKPTANFTFTPDTICKGDFITVTNLSVNGKKYTWLWNDETATVDTTIVISRTHKYDVAGDKRIQLLAERYGCTDTMSKLLTMNPPFAVFGAKYFCDSPLKVKFLDSSYRATKVLWIFGDGDTSTLRNPVHIFPDTGFYTVRMATANDSFGCVDTFKKIIQLFTRKPQFVANDTSVCLKDTVFVTEDRFSEIDSFSWVSSKCIINYDSARGKYYMVYLDTGSYSITLYYKNTHACIDSFTRKNYITVAKPYPKIIATPIVACAPATINFEDASTNTKGVKATIRTWLWGDATFKTDTSAKASKTYGTAGKYYVKMITTDNVGCVDSIVTEIDIRKPKANFAAVLDTFACVGQAIKFYSSATGGDITYYWDFGDGTKSNDIDPVHAYSSLGSFNVKLLVIDAAGCKDSITKMAFVKTVKPKADFVMSDTLSLCPPLFVNFTNTSLSGVRYAWDLGNGVKSTNIAPAAAYLDSGLYLIRLVAFDKYGCTDTAFKNAKVLGYNGLLTYSPIKGCAPLTVSFTAETINADVMVWDFADGYTESAVGKLSTTHTYTQPGSYVPRLILGDGKGCSTSSRGLDTIKVDKVTSTITSSPACVNTEITLNDSSYSYFSTWDSSLWTFDDGSISYSKNPKRTYNTAGSYPVKLITLNKNGCRDTLNSTIVVRDLPKVTAQDTVICLNDNANLHAYGALTYAWQPDISLSCYDCNSPITNSTIPKQYIVTGTDAYGCANKDTLDLGIKTKTTLIVANSAEACAQRPFQLLASGAQSYAWTPTTFLNNPAIPNPIATLDSNIIYQVIGREGSCIPDTALVKVTVHPLPEVNAGPDQKVLAGSEITLSGTGKNVVDYRWSPAEDLSCDNCPNPKGKISVTTIFTLKGTTQYGCSDSDDVQIVIFCDQSQLFIPNTFTPNGDGQNDYFYPQGKGVGKIKMFIIYNRWGQKVFERSNFDANVREQGWDGTFQGKPLNPDSFVYTLEATCDNGETVFFKGDVTIIK